MFQAKSEKPRAKTIFLSLALMSIIVISFASLVPLRNASAQASVIQTMFCTASFNDVSAFTCTLPSTSTNGDTLLVFYGLAGQQNGANTYSSLQTTFIQLDNRLVSSPDFFTMNVENGSINCGSPCSGGASASISTTSTLTTTLYIMMFELSGVKSAGIHVAFYNETSTGANTCCSLHSNTLTTYSHGFTVGFEFGNQNMNTCTPTANYVIFACNSATFINTAGEYSTSDTVNPQALTFTSTANNNNPYVYEGVAFNAGPFTTTVTQTVTGWVFPNFVAGVQSYSWFYGMIALLGPVGFLDSLEALRGNASSDSIVFMTLLGLFLGSVIGVAFNWLPVAIPFIFGALLAIYFWNGKR